MTKFRRAVSCIAVILGSAVFLWLGTIFQRTEPAMFASPDETAVYVFAKSWTFEGGFRIPHRLPDDLADISSLHPRSVARLSDALVPVGFLGMPMIIGLLESIWTGIGAWMTPILVLSSVLPLYLLVRKGLGGRVAMLSSIFYLSFPTILLYANRALFPNLPVVAFAIWAVWAAVETGRSDKGAIKALAAAAISGFAAGLALVIRPVEAVWLLPWICWGFAEGLGKRERSERKEVVKRLAVAGSVAAVVLFGGWFLARQTYGGSHGFFPVGYLIHDDAGLAAVPAVVSTERASGGFFSFLPFGFHPKTLWSNVRTYFGNEFGLWFGISLAGAAVVLKRRKGVDRQAAAVLGLSAWTLGVLLLLYGQSAYADNINGGATIGNSFLRYLLPIAPLVAVGCAIAVDRLFGLPRSRGVVIAPIVAALLATIGIMTALASDDEGLLRTRYELLRYASIRSAAERTVPAGAMILSERSDKIFFSGSYVSVSPLPNPETILRLRESGREIYDFTRTIGGDGKTDAVIAAFENAEAVFTLQNETMYELTNESANSHKTIKP